MNILKVITEEIFFREYIYKDDVHNIIHFFINKKKSIININIIYYYY